MSCCIEPDTALLGSAGGTNPERNRGTVGCMKLSAILPARRIPVVRVAAAMIAMFFVGGAVAKDGLFGEVTAAWVQAVGAIGAIWGAAVIAGRSEYQRLQEASAELLQARRIALATLRAGIHRFESVIDTLRDDRLAIDHSRRHTIVGALTVVRDQAAEFPKIAVESATCWHAFNLMQQGATMLIYRLDAFEREVEKHPPEAAALVLKGLAPPLQAIRDSVAGLCDNLQAEWGVAAEFPPFRDQPSA